MNVMTSYGAVRPSLTVGGVIRAAAWPVALLVLVAHVSWGDFRFPPESLLCAGILGAATVLVCARIRPHTFPIIHIVLFRYYLSMGFPVFSEPRMHTAVLGRVFIPKQAMADAHLASLLFAACLVVVAWSLALFVRRLRPSVAHALDSEGPYTSYHTVTARSIAAMSLVSYVGTSWLSWRLGELPASLGYIVSLFGCPEFSLGLLFWDAYKTRTYFSTFVCWTTVLILSLSGMATGMLGNAVWPWIAAILLLWTLYGRFPHLLFAVLFATVLVLNPAKMVYRQLSWHQTREPTLLERAENWAKAVDHVYSGVAENTSEASNDAATGLASRMSTMLQVMHMFDWVPGRIPHAGPRGYYDVPLFYVPSALWPERPNMTVEYNQRYALTFGIHTRGMTKSTTTTPPSVGDGYWRLGWPGVALEAALLGLVVGLFHGLASASARSLLIIGLGYVLSGGGPEGAAIAVLASLPKYLAVLLSVLLVAQWLPYVLGRSLRLGSTTPGERDSPPRTQATTAE